MKVLITGHRLFKLQCYDIEWIKGAIEEAICYNIGVSHGLSGMASGVDLWFCDACIKWNIPYTACPPFEGQQYTMSENEANHRDFLLGKAVNVRFQRNSAMLEQADDGIVVFDGNKGGTHNVFQQLIEKKKPFVWINPVSQKIWECM